MHPIPDIEALRDLRFLAVAGPLFDTLADVVFFVKDRDARYVMVNQTLVKRCGVDAKIDLEGKTTPEIFASPMGSAYHEQDRHILDGGAALRDLLELHLYLQGGPGWCITTKLPLHDAEGSVVGIVGVSNDVHMPAEQDGGYRELAKAIRHIQASFEEPLRLEALATMCGLSLYQFEQRVKKVFQLTAGQFISKTRIENACCMLMEKTAGIADIAVSCGFSDQSAFTRQFKATTGFTPTEYRRTSP
jgi:AraC-like DNA-binding protein